MPSHRKAKTTDSRNGSIRGMVAPKAGKLVRCAHCRQLQTSNGSRKQRCAGCGERLQQPVTDGK